MGAAPSAEARQVARAAAQWLALLESGAATEQDRAGLQRWRDSCASHEQARQKAQVLRQRFAELPSALALASLDRPQPGRRTLLKCAVGAAVLVPGAWLLGRQLPLDVWQADLHTATGERQRVLLADGSSLQLNTASAVDMDLQHRHLTLVAGEMALKVPGAAPMTIHTRHGQISVSAGELCVRQEPRGCRVSVYGGTAHLQPLQGPALALRGGQRVSLRAAGVVRCAAAGLARRRVAGAQPAAGGIPAGIEPLRQGVLRWAPELESLRVTGSFRLEDTDRVLALLTTSLFRIEQPAYLLDAQNNFKPDGELRNQGLELSVFGEPVRGLRLLGGVMLLDSEQTKTASGEFDGKRGTGSPEVNANLGAEWDIDSLHGLTLTARAIHTSSQYLDAANEQKIDGWERYDLGARYAFKVGASPVTVRVTVENVLDKTYWASAATSADSAAGLTLSTPRTWLVSTTVGF